MRVRKAIQARRARAPALLRDESNRRGSGEKNRQIELRGKNARSGRLAVCFSEGWARPPPAHDTSRRRVSLDLAPLKRFIAGSQRELVQMSDSSSATSPPSAKSPLSAAPALATAADTIAPRPT